MTDPQDKTALSRSRVGESLVHAGADTADIRMATLAGSMARLAEEDAQTVEGTVAARRLRCPEHGEELMAMSAEELRKLGWTHESLQVAIDAKRPTKEAPAYLSMANARVLARMRSQPDDKGNDGAKFTIVMPSATVDSGAK